mgnify:CR=1 FL=1
MNMNKKSFFLGAVAGIVMTVIVVLVIGLINKEKEGEEDPIEYLETPVSYENKSKTSFKVFQVGISKFSPYVLLSYFYPNNGLLLSYLALPAVGATECMYFFCPQKEYFQ